MKALFIGGLPLLFSLALQAEDTPLFGTVIGIGENDNLPVRAEATRHSKKLASLPVGARVGIDKCRPVSHIPWCRIHHLAQYDYEDFNVDHAPSGWVDARYLETADKGYVIIDGKPSCDYALRCRNGKCEVATDADTDDAGDIVRLTTEWIPRKHLTGASSFGAASDCCYCTFDRHIEAFLRDKKLAALQKSCGIDDACLRAIDTAATLRTAEYPRKLATLIHPSRGLTLTYNVRFGGKEDRRFTRKEILEADDPDAAEIYWGRTYGKGEPVYLTLEKLLQTLTRPLAAITKIEKLDSPKGFSCAHTDRCRAYEIRWIDAASETRAYDYQGLVIILEPYHGHWYVTAMLRDRWTI